MIYWYSLFWQYYAESLISYDVLLEIICGEKTDKQDYSYFLHICAVNIPSDRRFLRVTPEGGVDACGKVTDKNSTLHSAGFVRGNFTRNP